VVEYVRIIASLLKGGAVSQAGEFYTVDKLILKPPLPRELFPGILMSGSSEAGLGAAKAFGATAVRYPGPSTDYGIGVAGEDVDAEGKPVTSLTLPDLIRLGGRGKSIMKLCGHRIT
jgi:alkanesulfonate monooxygenase SsuD/methylene tetrahydromethanopterin reductase-like flavin-dependent oxidoreductase (luciferase family)